MQIEIGKYYKTRDGRKAGPIVANDGGPLELPYQALNDGSGKRESYTWDGRTQLVPGDCLNDLVDECVDDCGDIAAPTFKRGDRVRFKADDENQIHRSMWFNDMPEVLVVDGRNDIGTIKFEGTTFVADEEWIEHAPWYPDDSGEWVEYSGGGRPVNGDVVVDVLLRREREAKRFRSQPMLARFWIWDQRGSESKVAYRVVAAPPLVIREGAYYIDEAGKTIGPMIPYTNSGFIVVHGDGRVWNPDGSCRFGDAARLVRETTAPAPAAAPAPTAPAPYFLVHGDAVTHFAATIEEARAEARRLAALHPGVAFSVMQSVERVVVPVSPVEVTRYA